MGDKLSDWFGMGNGTRQGGILSPKLFNIYIRETLSMLTSSNVGCKIFKQWLNALAYADDLILLSPSWYGMKVLLEILHNISELHNLCINLQKKQLRWSLHLLKRI